MDLMTTYIIKYVVQTAKFFIPKSFEQSNTIHIDVAFLILLGNTNKWGLNIWFGSTQYRPKTSPDFQAPRRKSS